VSQEVARFLAIARSFLAKAEGMLGQGWPDESGRASHMAAFHAAQALIFQRSGRVVKTHQGVHAEFARIVKHEGKDDREIWRFLRAGYALKSVADYGTDPSVAVTDEEAKVAIDEARRFLDQLVKLLPPEK
jgi:uncharacterized protein (UPF0332 family)